MAQSLTETMQTFAARAGKGEAIDEQAWSWLVGRMHYMRGDFTQPDTFSQLGKLLADQQSGRTVRPTCCSIWRSPTGSLVR